MKVLKTVAIVVGAVALVATGIGAAVGAGAFLGVSGATFATVGTIASVTAGALTLATAAFAPGAEFSNQGNPLTFQTNPNSGLPYAIGRTRMSGLKIDGKTGRSAGSSINDLLFFAALLSCSPADAIEAFTADNESVTFNGTTGAATSANYANWMAQKVSLGPAPQTSALALSMNGIAFPGWSLAHKLSGMPHALWALRFDKDGNHYSAGVPEPEWIGRWSKCYDPRKDSTYPGGSGSHRAGNEATYEWTRNPGLHGLTWALGRWSNGKKVCGIGAPVANIRIAEFVEAANVADANGWGCGGVEWTTDSKWDALKRILQAGGAKPTKSGAMIGCRVKAPRVSIGTITADDLLDGLSYSAMKRRRERFNTVLPRYVSESHDWQVITGSAIKVPEWVTADGAPRTKGIDFPLVQAEVGQAGFNGNQQAGQLAAYEICDSREAGPIQFALGPKWIGLRSGDCVTLNVPAEGFSSQKVVLIGISVDPASGKISCVAETETDSKHPFALGETTVPPPAPTLTTPPAIPPQPGAGVWTLSAAPGADGIPQLVLTGATGSPSWDHVLFQYRKVGAPSWTVAGQYRDDGSLRIELPGVDGATNYEARVAYSAQTGVGEWRVLTAITTPAAAIDGVPGDYFETIYLCSTTPPATPSDVSLPDKWSTLPPATAEAFYIQTVRNHPLTGSRLMAVQPGDQFEVQGDCDATAANFNCRLYMVFYQADAVTPTISGAFPGTNNIAPGTSGICKGTLVAPAGAAWVGFAMLIDGASGFGTAEWSNVRIINPPTRWASRVKRSGVDNALIGSRSVPSQDSGTHGNAGLSIAELTIYKRAATAPTTPSGGSYDFATKVLTPPSGWTSTFPSAGSDPVYAASGVASVQGLTGTATPSWLGVGQAAANGINGNDGQATNVIFKRSATQPATPLASTGIPAGWYDNTGSIPAGETPVWASFGTRPNSGAVYTWQIAKRIEGVDGVSPVSAFAQPPNVTIRGLSSGGADPSEFPKYVQFAAFKDGAQIAIASIVQTFNSNITSSISDGSVVIAGALIISGAGAGEGYAVIEVTAGGETHTLKVTTQVIPVGANGSTSASKSYTSPQLTSTTYAAMTPPVAFNANGAGQIKVSASDIYRVVTGGVFSNCQGKLQYSADGSSWTDVAGSETTGTGSTEEVEPGSAGIVVPGSLSIAPITITALTPGAPYQIRYMSRKTGASANSASRTATVLAETP